MTKKFLIPPHLINTQAHAICETLNLAGYQAYLVGGCVRDLLLGTKPKDWDITTDASPEKVMEIFKKTIPTGLQHGTVTVVLGEGVENHFEVTTFRVEGEYTDGRRPEEVVFVKNVEQDLARRDLTINAIAFNPISNEIIDPFKGMEDLEAGFIRAVGSPEERFREDGLRIMRVCRFSARFKYNVHHDTFEGMKNSIDTLKKVSKESIKDELCKTLMTKNPSYGISLLKGCGALEIACPFLCSSPPYFQFVSKLNRCQGNLETRIALMYANCNVKSVTNELMSLKFSNKEIKRVSFLLDLLDEFLILESGLSSWTYKVFMAFIKNNSPDPWTYTLEQFIHLTEAMKLSFKVMLEKYEEMVILSRKEMVLNGDDLLAAGMPPGPRIKKALDECYLVILKNPELNTREHLLKHASQF
jgi:tRNA nucleotidyltransferase (CCA-adding enzyme)